VSRTGLRAGVLGLVSLASWAAVRSGRHLVKVGRQQALAAEPFAAPPGTTGAGSPAVCILAFSSADCRQCHTMQAPALRRVLEARGDAVVVHDIDAPSEPELTRRYRVLTVPTTVVLDATGRAHAINYGFASTQRLLEQVDAILA